MKRTVELTISPGLSIDDMNGVLQLRADGCDVVLHGDRRITVPTDDTRAEVWLRKRDYQLTSAEPREALQLPVAPVLRSAD